MNDKESEEVKARDARLKKIREQEGDLHTLDQIGKDAKVPEKISDQKKTGP